MNWVPKPSFDLLLKGQLPDIKVPTSTSDSKYCQVSVLDGSAVECRFSVRYVADSQHCQVSVWSVASLSGKSLTASTAR